MEVNLDNDGVWFELDDVKIQLRTCTLDEFQRIKKATAKRKREFKQGQVYEYLDVDEDLQQQMIMDYCIVAWENITHKKQPLPCTAENKMKLAGGRSKISLFIQEKIAELASFDTEQKKLAEKN